MTTLYLIRHAEAEGNLYRRIHGWYDALVTPNGLRQIKALEGRFANVPVDAAYSSDLYRTKTTAKAVYLPKGLPLHTDPGLREVHMGDWEDHPWGEIRETDGERLARFNRSDPTWQAPNGESLGQVGERMERTIRTIAQGHPNQTVALFSHGTAIRQFLANVRGIKPEDWHTLPHADNTAVTCLAWDGEAFHVIFEGDNTHLDDSISTLPASPGGGRGPTRGRTSTCGSARWTGNRTGSPIWRPGGTPGSQSTGQTSPSTGPPSGRGRSRRWTRIPGRWPRSWQRRNLRGCFSSLPSAVRRRGPGFYPCAI